MKFRVLFTIVTFLFIFSKLQAKNDEEPITLKKLLKESELISTVTIVEGGVFRAKARITFRIRGEAENKEIWLKGFSNINGKLDTLKEGENYLIFANKIEQIKQKKKDKEAFRAMGKSFKEKAMKDSIFVVMQNNSYQIWKPEVSKYLIEKNRISCKLFNPESIYPENETINWLETKVFLQKSYRYCNKKDVDIRYLMTIIKRLDESNENASHRLQMLDMCGNKEYFPVFHHLANDKNPKTRRALVNHLEKIKSRNAQNLVFNLIGDSDYAVFKKAFDMMSKKLKGPELGPFLISLLPKDLPKTKLGSPESKNIKFSIGSKDIIEKIGNYNFKPAIPKIIPLLEYEALFFPTLIALDKMGVSHKTYDFQLKKYIHTESGRKNFLSLCNFIIEKNNQAGKEGLKQYIRKYENKKEKINYGLAISSLSNFDDEQTKKFLIYQYKKLLTTPLEENFEYKWIYDYFNAFKDYKSKEVNIRDLVFRGMNYTLGIDKNFANIENLFQTKKEIETQLNTKVKDLLKSYEIIKVESRVFLKNTFGIVKRNETPQYDYLLLIHFNEKEDNSALTIGNHIYKSHKQIITNCSEKLGINKSMIGVRTGKMITNMNQRFVDNAEDNPLISYYEYLEDKGKKEDKIFIKKLKEEGYITEYDIEQFEKTMNK